jgi:hypothetical protein
MGENTVRNSPKLKLNLLKDPNFYINLRLSEEILGLNILYS